MNVLILPVKMKFCRYKIQQLEEEIWLPFGILF